MSDLVESTHHYDKITGISLDDFQIMPTVKHLINHMSKPGPHTLQLFLPENHTIESMKRE